MDLRFHIDPATGLAHIYGHKVTEVEVEEILKEPGEDRQGHEGSRVRRVKRKLAGTSV